MGGPCHQYPNIEVATKLRVRNFKFSSLGIYLSMGV